MPKHVLTAEFRRALELGHLREASELLTQIGSAEGQLHEAEEVETLYQALITGYRVLGIPDGPRPALEHRLRIDPHSVWAWRELANTYFRTGDFEAAKQVCHRQVAVRREYASSRGIGVSARRYFGNTFTSAIGHICMLAFYAKLAELDPPPLERDVLVPGKVANACLLSYVKDYFAVTAKEEFEESTGARISLLEEPLLMMRSMEGWRYFYDGCVDIERRWEAQGRGALLRLRDDDVEYGRVRLAQAGMPGDAWFVALHVREAPTGEIRNADVLDYLPAIREVTSRGGWVVRMGNPTMTPLPRMDNVIDYAHSAVQSDRVDVYLVAGCRFFIGTNSGPAYAPGLFGVPVLQTNLVPLLYAAPSSHDIVLPVMFRSRGDGRLIPLRDLLTSALAHAEYPVSHRGRTVEIVPNRAADLVDGVREMFDGLGHRDNGARVLSRRQEQVLALCNELKLCYRTPVGDRFLQQHPGLLG